MVTDFRPLARPPFVVDLTSRRATRWALGGLCTVLLVFAAVAVGGALRTKAVADGAGRATVLASVYGQARFDVATEESLERKYRLEPGAGVRREHRAAGRWLEGALRHAAVLEPSSAPFVSGLLNRHATYAVDTRLMFEAVDAGDLRRVLALDHNRTEPDFGAIERAVDDSADAHARSATRALRRLRTTESAIVNVTPIIFTVGLGFLALCGGVLFTQRRRLGLAQDREIERLRRVALTDPLTGLGNHRAFHEDVGAALLRADAAGTPLAIAMIDADDLKQVNDLQGHQAGDERLVATARALTDSQHESEHAYRVGGDEFVWILPAIGAWGAAGRVQVMQGALAAASGGTATVTVGVGERGGTSDKEELIRRADRALIEAKRAHRPLMLYGADIEPRTDGPAAGDDHHAKTLATALAMAVDAKDSYTRSHCGIVSELAARTGAELGLDPARVAQLRLAGLLHDVGKIGIPDAVLQKPGKLTPAEYELIKTHSALGREIVLAAELEAEAEWVLRHHERPDGRGYPDGLANDSIPLEAKILAVADTFEAITSDRPYQVARSIDIAFDELERNAGTQFDPECVAALRRAVGQPTGAPAPSAGAALAAVA
jgi:diguanylate cyclase (GGDEF)-like protein